MHALRLLLLVLTIAGLAAPSAARGAFNHAYTTDGSLQSRANAHSGAAWRFDPDALGRPQSARIGTTSYVSSIDYHPNGLIADADYLNGQLLTQTLDPRQLPDVLKTVKPGGTNAVWLDYGYDARRKIASVADLDGVGGNESRTFTYDANGRLLTAAGPWGAGTFKYDALGNLREQKLGSRTIAVSYDAATNRVSSANNGGTVRAYGFDARGNATGVAGNTFTYDFAKRHGVNGFRLDRAALTAKLVQKAMVMITKFRLDRAALTAKLETCRFRSAVLFRLDRAALTAKF